MDNAQKILKHLISCTKNGASKERFLNKIVVDYDNKRLISSNGFILTEWFNIGYYISITGEGCQVIELDAKIKCSDICIIDMEGLRTTIDNNIVTIGKPVKDEGLIKAYKDFLSREYKKEEEKIKISRKFISKIPKLRKDDILLFEINNHRSPLLVELHHTGITVNTTYIMGRKD